MTQQDSPAAPESSVEDRLAAFFGGPKVAPQVAPQQPEATEPPEQEAAPVSPPEEEAPAEQEVEASDEQASDAPPEGFVELEHLGKKYHVPPDLKTAFEANRAQATKSAMELAPVRKALEVEKLALQAAKVADGEVKELAARKAQLESYKEQAKKVDWSQLTLDQKVDLDRELRLVNDEIVQVDSQISAKRTAAERQFGELVIQAVQQTENFMATKVPGWNQERGKSLHEYGVTLGIPAEKLTAGWFADPVATLTMWKAQQWDSLQASKPSVTQKASAAAPVIKPASNAAQKAVASSKYNQARTNLKKTGSLQDFAAALLAKR